MQQQPQKSHRPVHPSVELIAAQPVPKTTQYRGARAVRFWLLAAAVSLGAWVGIYLVIRTLLG